MRRSLTPALVGAVVVIAGLVAPSSPASSTPAPTPMLLASVDVGTAPVAVAVNPASTRVYVANSTSNNVSVINALDGTVTSTVSLASGASPSGIAVNPTGANAYVTNSGSDSVSVINTATNSVTTPVTLAAGSGPSAIAVSPDGTRAYVANNGNNTVNVINTSTYTIDSTITGLSSPRAIAINPAGTRAYVANNGNNTVNVIDTSNNTITGSVNVGVGPAGVAVSPDGSYVYVAYVDANNEGEVKTIDTATNTVVATTETNGNGASGIATSPDGARVYVALRDSNKASILSTRVVTTCNYAHAWPGGTGVPGNPYQVADQDDLDAIRSCKNSAFIQTHDIALSGSWTPIGTWAASFTGTYDGDEHTITGLVMDNTSAPSGEPVGLFGMAQGATMRDLTISGGQVSVTRDEVGLLVGNCDECEIASVEVTGTVTVAGNRVGGLIGLLTGTAATLENSSSAAVVQGNSLTGGLVGVVVAATVTDTSASGAVTGTTKVGGLAGAASNFALLDRTCASGSVTGSQQVGGLVGVLGPPDFPTPGNAATISRSFASGNVTATDPSRAEAGGLVGTFWNNSADYRIANSFATGSVVGAGKVGGLVGDAEPRQAITATSYAVGALSGPADNSTGGAFGEVGATDAAFYSAVYWNTETTGRAFGVGGYSLVTTGLNISNVSGLTSEQMRYSTNFAGWDFTSVWGYDCQVSTYPLLRWAYPSATASSCPTGGAAPAPTPTVAAAQPTVSPTTEPEAELPVTRQPPGSARATINGQQVSVTATTLRRGQGTRIAFGPVTFTLRSTTPTGQPVPLSPQGALIIARAGELPATGGGLAPASQVDMTLYSSPVQLGTAQVTPAGTISSTPTIPSTTPLGAHTLVLTGVTDTGADFVLELGVRVARPVAALGAAPVVSVRPRDYSAGDVLTVRASGVQAGCTVTWSLGEQSASARASAQGQAATTLVAPNGRRTLTTMVGGKGCAKVSLHQKVPASRS